MRHSLSPKIPVSTLAISGEGEGEGGTYLAPGQNDSMISMWDITVPDRTEQRMEILRGHEKAVSALTFAGNRVLVSGSEEGKICTWRLASSGRTRVNQCVTMG
jgi:WD40 repeat protein